jgi:hypothetical protein
VGHKEQYLATPPKDRRIKMNRKIVVFAILGLFLGNISACQSSERTAEPWIPVLEDTSFSYLKDSVSEAVKALKEAEKRIRNSEEKYDALFQPVMDSLLNLHFYYVPMTEVRQLVYDADRLFYLRQTQQAQEKLKRAHEVLLNIATANGPHLEESVNEVIASIDDLSVNIQESSGKVLEKLREVGRRVNFMCLKGELVLSGDTFWRRY